MKITKENDPPLKPVDWKNVEFPFIAELHQTDPQGTWTFLCTGLGLQGQVQGVYLELDDKTAKDVGFPEVGTYDSNIVNKESGHIYMSKVSFTLRNQ